MAKFIGGPSRDKQSGRALQTGSANAPPSPWRQSGARQSAPQRGRLPNASIIYGLAAVTILGISLYHLVSNPGFTGVLLLIMAAVLFGYAWHFQRYR